jgi:hypothetical protein
MSKSFVVIVDRKSYTWNDGRWYGTDDYLKPCQGLIHKLNALLPPAPVKSSKGVRAKRKGASEPLK